MNIIVDTMLDYIRIVSYATVILSSLKDVANRKFGSLLFIGDAILALLLISVVIYIHLFEVSVQNTIIDDVLLTSGAVIWAVIHFICMIKWVK